jgi:hypothetical protein
MVHNEEEMLWQLREPIFVIIYKKEILEKLIRLLSLHCLTRQVLYKDMALYEIK